MGNLNFIVKFTLSPGCIQVANVTIVETNITLFKSFFLLKKSPLPALRGGGWGVGLQECVE